MELTIQDLRKKYGDCEALRGLTTTFTPGIYGLLGPNGAGKSTLMNIITDNLLPTAGKALYNGAEIHSLGKKYRSILGYMPQQQGIYEQFTAKRFLYYHAALRGMDSGTARERIRQVLKMVGLENEAGRRLGGFSGGMKQRILIAQAILGDPEVLVLDEPTAGLDPQQRIAVRNLISQISFNKIVIIATHIVSDIESIAKEILLLKKGKLIVQDTPLRLVRSMSGRVFEITVHEEELPKISSQFRISNIYKYDEEVRVRIVSEEPPSFSHVTEPAPNLEDVYLYYFGDAGGMSFR